MTFQVLLDGHGGDFTKFFNDHKHSYDLFQLLILKILRLFPIKNLERKLDQELEWELELELETKSKPKCRICK